MHEKNKNKHTVNHNKYNDKISLIFSAGNLVILNTPLKSSEPLKTIVISTRSL